MSGIHVQNLAFTFKSGHTPFSHLTFTLRRKLTGLIGRNGSGKSTLASILAGYKTPSAGSLSTQWTIGYLRQISEGHLSQTKTISQVLGINPVLEALNRVQEGEGGSDDIELIGDQWSLKENLEQQMALLGLPEDLQLPAHSISGGQIARLSLYALFQSSDDYLILDEPSNHLDLAGKEWLVKQLKQFKGGILIISHERDVLQHVDEILERPYAHFILPINIIYR